LDRVADFESEIGISNSLQNRRLQPQIKGSSRETKIRRRSNEGQKRMFGAHLARAHAFEAGKIGPKVSREIKWLAETQKAA
jgi:hypothetical protein